MKPPSLSKLIVTPSFCFPFKIPDFSDNPTLITIYLYMYASFQMRKFFAMVKDTTGKDNESKERKLTMMMLSVVGLFLISNTMWHVCAILLQEMIITTRGTNIILRPFYSFLQVLNSSVNIFFYTYFNTIFRQNLISLFDFVRLPCFKAKTEMQGQPIHLNLISKTQVTDVSTTSTH